MASVPACANEPQHIDPMDEPVDLSELPPLGDEREFAAIMDELIADETPRLFAVVQELGERVDGWVAAWGMAFADHAEMIFADGVRWVTLRTPDRALRALRSDPDVRTRLVWVSPRPEDEETA